MTLGSKISTLFGYGNLALGSAFIILTYFQYYVSYKDIDKLVAYSMVGILLIFIGILFLAIAGHSKRLFNLTNTLDQLEDYIDDEERR